MNAKKGRKPRVERVVKDLKKVSAVVYVINPPLSFNRMGGGGSMGLHGAPWGSMGPGGPGSVGGLGGSGSMGGTQGAQVAPWGQGGQVGPGDPGGPGGSMEPGINREAWMNILGGSWASRESGVIFGNFLGLGNYGRGSGSRNPCGT